MIWIVRKVSPMIKIRMLRVTMKMTVLTRAKALQLSMTNYSNATKSFLRRPTRS